MKRSIPVVVAVAVLALAPGAAAKGPHAIVEPGPGGIAPGESWVATLTINELGGRVAAHPRLVLHSGPQRLVVRPARVDAQQFRLTVVFPRAGRWSYAVLSGGRRFEFPAAVIGRGAERDTTAFVAFPKGSPAARQGAGGPIYGDTSPGEGGESLPPEVVVAAARETGGSGVPLWIPAAGLALVGAGTITAVRRRRH